jgi:hypothetical protein
LKILLPASFCSAGSNTFPRSSSALAASTEHRFSSSSALGQSERPDRVLNAARWRLVLYPAPDFGVVEALQDALQSRRGQ